MAESEEQVPVIPEHEGMVETEGYKPPSEKSVRDISALDVEDESLQGYKEALLKGTGGPEHTGNVMVRKMSMQVEGRPDLEFDLDKDTSQKKFIVKEGVKYKLMLTFNIQEESVSGLKFINNKYKKSIVVDKNVWMVGNYGPSKDSYTWTCPEDEFPSGMVNRGVYTVNSALTGDGGNNIFQWEWGFEIKKDWE